MTLLFTVAYTLESDMGVVVIGWAPHPETPLPKRGEEVEVHNPDGGRLRAEIADVELTFSTRSCFTEKTVNRAVLVERGAATGVQARAKVWRLAEVNT